MSGPLIQSTLFQCEIPAWRARQYVAGRHYVRGRLADTPRHQRAPGEEPPRGTRRVTTGARSPAAAPIAEPAAARAVVSSAHGGYSFDPETGRK